MINFPPEVFVPPVARRKARRSLPEVVGRPLEFGVSSGASVAVMAALLKYDADTPQPFCTCTNRRIGFGFDPQVGLYVHADPNCWKPSKGMYVAACQAGVILPEAAAAP